MTKSAFSAPLSRLVPSEIFHVVNAAAFRVSLRRLRERTWQIPTLLVSMVDYCRDLRPTTRDFKPEPGERTGGAQ